MVENSQESCYISLLQNGDSSLSLVVDLPSRGQLVNQAAEHEFGVKRRTIDRKRHREKKKLRIGIS